MKAVVAAFNQEKALVGAFSVITNLRMELFEPLVQKVPGPGPGQIMGLPRGLDSCSSCYSGDTGQDGKQNRSQLSIIISLSCCQTLHSTDPSPAPSLPDSCGDPDSWQLTAEQCCVCTPSARDAKGLSLKNLHGLNFHLLNLRLTQKWEIFDIFWLILHWRWHFKFSGFPGNWWRGT